MNTQTDSQTANASGVGSSDGLHRTWITQALCAGGKLTVNQMLRGKTILRARMDWQDETPIIGGISTSLNGALDNLEQLLAADAAREMQESGAV